MTYPKIENYFLLALILGVSVLVFFIFEPFLYSLILAMIFATVFEPVHKRIFTLFDGRAGLSALCATLFVVIITVVPVSLLGTQIFSEASQLYTSLAGGETNILGEVEKIFKSLGIPFLSMEAIGFSQYIKQGLGFLIQNLGTVFSNIANIVADLFILLIALYFFFKDGSALKKKVIKLSPLHDVHDETVFRKLGLSINSVFRGSILIGLVQGVLTAIGLAIFGVPNAVLWGSVAAIAALIPGIGTALVLLPAIAFLFFTGETASSLGLLAWGVVAVGLVDNVLGPKLMSRGVHVHPFLVLLSMLGGIGVFGPLGFLFGPIVLSMLFVLLEIYSAVRTERNA